MKRISSLILIFILTFQSLASPVYALKSTQETTLNQKTIKSDNEDDEIPLFEEHSNSSNLLITLQNGVQVEVLEEFDDFSYVEYLDSETNGAIRGFIQNEYLEVSADIEESKDSELEDNEEETDVEEADVEEADVEEEDEVKEDDKDIDESEQNVSPNEDDLEVEEDITDEVEEVENTEETTETAEEEKQEQSTKQKIQSNIQQELTVVGRRNPTNVRAEDSTKTEVIATFKQGELIKLKTYSEDWYEVTVEVNGKNQTGFIHHKHVDNIIDNPELFSGIGIKNPTNVRARASTKSEVKKALPIGSIINLKTFSTYWYEVIANGKSVGYVHHKHIGDTVNEKKDNFKGIGINSPTYVRKLPSTKAKAESALPIGSIMNLKTFSKHWYKVTLSNGKIGYVHKKHVGDTVNEKKDNFKGIGINSPTYVRKLPSTKAKAESVLPIGSIINLNTFSKHWYKATLVGGKTGYIHKKHIGDTVNEKKDNFKGIGINSPTYVRKFPSTKAKAESALPIGSIIKLNTFSKHWYKATLAGGKTGYVHKKHVGDTLFNSQEYLYGIGAKNPTNIRTLPSTQAKITERINRGSFIGVKTFSKHWYEVTLSNGKTGYVHKKHIDITTNKVNITTTHYNHNYNDVVNTQMNGSPQVSGPKGGWLNASRQQIEYYLNPSNFNMNSSEFYQFLVLSQPASLNAKEVNERILHNKGVLKNRAQAFIDAGKKFNINEAYLISHALLETGNGTSDLAKGIHVDRKGKIVSKEKAYKTVYNVYGIGAKDSCPKSCGAKEAFDKEWFSVEKAIIGGAQFINTYIDRGQDTLYKMRWNPETPGYPQYATDIGWAVKQTSRISQIYDLLEDYTLVFDVPKYKNQPDSSGDPNKYINIYLEVIANSLNIRSSTNTGSSANIIGGASQGTLLTPKFNSSNKIITKSAGGHLWYNINYNNRNAWVSGGINGTQYIKITN